MNTKPPTTTTGGDQLPRRQYKSWPSKNKFWCGGRLIHGPDRYYFWTSSVALIGGGGSFLVFVAPELYKGDVVPPWWNIALIPVFAFVWLYTILMHHMVAYMDPGIIPRQPPPPMPETDDTFLMGVYSPPVSHNIVVNSTAITVKWCPTCNLYRPPRAIHCGICDNCVHRFDHHCPYVGNCIGLRNYRFFVFFIYGVLFCSLFGFSHSLSLVIIRVVRHGFYGAFSIGPLGFIFAWIVALLTLVSTGLLVTLVGLTSFLISVGRTTNENIKHAFPTKNPFHLGCFWNWFTACCPARYPSAINPRGLIGGDVGGDVGGGVGSEEV